MSRRRALQIGVVTSTMLAGCGRSDASDGQTSSDGGDDDDETDPNASADAIDIREYGAAVDGLSDDTKAVTEAIEAAEPGDTVFFPEGTTVVSTRQGTGPRPEDDWGPAIYLDSSNNGVTLQGEGRKSIIKMAGGHPKGRNSFVIQVDCEDPVENVEVRDLVVDGNRSENPQYTVIGVTCWPGEARNDVLIENVLAQNCSEVGIQLKAAGTRINQCTARKNTRHGINLSNKSFIIEPSTKATNVVAIDNDGLGIDHNGGAAVVDGFYAAGNKQGGMKFSRNAMESVVKNGFFISNQNSGFRYNGSQPPDETIPVQIDNVIAKDNGYAGFWLSGDTRYDIGCIVSKGNNTAGEQEGNIEILGRSKVSADNIISSGAHSGYGIYHHSERQILIDRYMHMDNPRGAYNESEFETLEIKEELEEQIIEPDMPSIDTLGATFARLADTITDA